MNEREEDHMFIWRYLYEGDEEGSLFKTFAPPAVHQALTVLIDAYYERESGPTKVR